LGYSGSTPILVAQEWLLQKGTLVFSGPQFWWPWSGVMMALHSITINKLLRCLWNFILRRSQSDSNNEAESLGGTIRKIETAVGLWTLVTVSIALLLVF